MRKHYKTIFFDNPNELSLTIERDEWTTLYFTSRRNKDGEIIDFTASIAVAGGFSMDFSYSTEEMDLLRSFLGYSEPRTEELPAALLEMHCDSQQQQRFN